MLENGCAFACTVLSLLCGVVSWYSMTEGDWSGMIIVSCFAGIEALLAALVLASKFSL